VEKGLVDPGQIDETLREQSLTGDRLGEILLGHGWISGSDLIEALAEQQGIDLQSGRPPDAHVSVAQRPGEMALGRLLVERGEITEEQLEQALERESETGLRLGEVLRAAGTVSAKALAEALAEQQGKRAELTSWSRAQSDSVERTVTEELGEHDLGDSWFELHELERGRRTKLYTSRRFVDTADVALAVLSEWNPEQLEIVEVEAGHGRLRWRYPSGRSDAGAGR
jgi:hypothetical protein